MSKRNLRGAGVLLHPSSLYGAEGIGTFGRSANDFLHFMEKSGLSYWQFLPLGPTGFGESPYSSLSVFAGNPLLIDMSILAEKGYLKSHDLPFSTGQEGPIDFNALRTWKEPLLKQAARNFLKKTTKGTTAYQGYQDFVKKASFWLDDFVLFICLKEYFEEEALKNPSQNLGAWCHAWPMELRQREEKALASWNTKLAAEQEEQRVIQYFFYEQWQSIRLMAHQKGIQLIGDIPIFVALDSSDVWAKPTLFKLKKDGTPLVVAGVPPDNFSPVGQLWGMPVYNWTSHKEDSFAWWIQRFRWLSEMVDVIRIDHFRGFESAWEVSADADNAVEGKWVKAPGALLFSTVLKELPHLKIIVEDLGHITPEVTQLRDRFSFPGMRVLQYGFMFGQEGPHTHNQDLPHTYSRNSVVYPGTHDNMTLRSWFNSASMEEKIYAQDYLSTNENAFVWDAIRATLASVSDYAIIQMQDLLNLAEEGRMNVPARLGGGNWCWRMKTGALSDALAGSLHYLVYLYGRHG